MAADTARLLVLVTQDDTQVEAQVRIARSEGWDTRIAADGEQAVTMAAGSAQAAIFLPIVAGRKNVREAVALLCAKAPMVPVIVSLPKGSALHAIEAMDAGASDVLIDPASTDRFARALQVAGRSRTTTLAGLDRLMPDKTHIMDFDAMVGTDGRFRTALAKAATAARGHGHMLVEGERGTGKRTLLHAVHHGSARAKAPVQIVQCDEAAGNTIQSVLFGHVKGAFAGAFERREGALATCDGGTLLIEAIDLLDRETQDRLAAGLKDGIVRPIGAAHGFRIDVRVLASSRRPLDVLVEDGRFSPELYDALSATRLALPPLRDRTGDIPALTRHFLASFAAIEGMGHHSIADSALSLLETYDWPGNIRQLQTALFRACVHEQREALTAHSFPHLSELVGDAIRGESRTRGLGVLLYQDDGHIRTLEDIEADIIRLAIGQYRGKMTEVARRLGIGRSTLYRKLHELGIDNAA